MRLLRLYGMLFSLSLRRQIAFRADFFFEIGRTIIGVITALAALLAVFTRTTQLGGFSAGEAVALLGTFQIVSGLRQALVEPNLRFNGQQIANGSFDAVLTQPAPAIFLTSLGGAAPLALVQPALGVLVVVAGTVYSDSRPTIVGVLAWVVLVLAAGVVMWATRCIIAAAVFWALGISLDVAYDGAWQLGAYPTTMLAQPLRTLFYVVPVAFIATVPTAVLVGKLTPTWALTGIAAAAIATALAIGIWRLGIRNYTSATS